MPQDRAAFQPKSALFSKSDNQKTRAPIALYVVFTLLVVSNIALGLALTMGTEISNIWSRAKAPVLVAYETRIMQLRMEVDRLHSQQYLQAGNLNLQLQELLQQQQILTEQNDYIQVLVQKSEDLGITSASANIPTQISDSVVTGSIFTRSPGAQTKSNAPMQVAAIQSSLNQMTINSNFVLQTLADDAERSTTHILNQLSPLGIVPRYQAQINSGVGGPFVPVETTEQSSAMALKANQALTALQTFSQVRNALNAAPVRFPLPAPNRISSAFGTRSDPFGGTRAFHSGIDYPAPAGTGVFATGPGKITFAGRKGGYGNFIEIDHGNGLISRYGHLSRILVQSGQQVAAGANIGKVGSTGRSTGPHLHFEIRRNQTAINPQNFLDVGKQLAEFLS